MSASDTVRSHGATIFASAFRPEQPSISHRTEALNREMRDKYRVVYGPLDPGPPASSSAPGGPSCLADDHRPPRLDSGDFNDRFQDILQALQGLQPRPAPAPTKRRDGSAKSLREPDRSADRKGKAQRRARPDQPGALVPPASLPVEPQRRPSNAPPTARERRIFPAGAGAAAVRQLARLEGLLLPPRAALRPPSPIRGSSAIAGLRPPAVRSHSLPCPQELTDVDLVFLVTDPNSEALASAGPLGLDDQPQGLQGVPSLAELEALVMATDCGLCPPLADLPPNGGILEWRDPLGTSRHPSVAGSSASSETYAEPEDEEVVEAEAASIAAPEDEPLNDENEQEEEEEEEEEEEDDEDEEDNEGTAEAGGAGAGPPGLAAQLSVAVRQAALAGRLAEVSGLLCPAGLLETADGLLPDTAPLSIAVPPPAGRTVPASQQLQGRQRRQGQPLLRSRRSPTPMPSARQHRPPVPRSASHVGSRPPVARRRARSAGVAGAAVRRPRGQSGPNRRVRSARPRDRRLRLTEAQIEAMPMWAVRQLIANLPEILPEHYSLLLRLSDDDVKPRHASPADVATLPVAMAAAVEEECVICLEPVEEGQLTITLPRCQHRYHARCIVQHLVSYDAHCPLCKSAVFAD